MKYMDGVLQTLDSVTGAIQTVDYSNATREQNISKNRYQDKIPCIAIFS